MKSPIRRRRAGAEMRQHAEKALAGKESMPSETAAGRKARAAKIIAILRQTYPQARIALNFKNPLELLVATILSAQCTDKRVNMVTGHLFDKYRTARDYAAADPAVFEEEIRSTGFYHNKTKSVLGAAIRLVREFGGNVPDTMDGLLTLPGVARKTANVVLSGAFGKKEGIVVDTHVIRVSGRLRLTAHDDNSGDRIEKDLMALVPREAWTDLGNMLIWHGRLVCSARRPDCAGCPVNKLCPSASGIS
jgi:endonuclease-3